MNMNYILCRAFSLIILVLPELTSFSQYQNMEMKNMKMDKDSMMPESMDSMKMTHAFSLSLLMNRNSSGTAWQPDATPVFGYIVMTKRWN